MDKGQRAVYRLLRTCDEMTDHGYTFDDVLLHVVRKDAEDIKKELRIKQIIEDKKLNVGMFIHLFVDYEEYNSSYEGYLKAFEEGKTKHNNAYYCTEFSGKPLTKEEFEILKDHFRNKKTIETDGMKALEKIDHTVCLAFNENNNAIFGKDCYDGIDCKDILEFCDCYDKVAAELKAGAIREEILSIIKREPVEVVTDVLSFATYEDLKKHYEEQGGESHIKDKREFCLLKGAL